MTDLYAALGLPRDCTADDVKRAYRAKSKKAHPDMPEGSEEKFALVKLAKDVLGDARRRATYDQTGAMDEPAPDNTEAAARNHAFMAFGYVVDTIEQRNANPDEYDVMRDVLKRLNLLRAEENQRVKKGQQGVEKTERLAKRLHAKEGKKDLLSPMLAARIGQMKQELAGGEQKLREYDRAIEIVSDVEFDHGAPKSQPPGFGPAAMTLNDFIRSGGWV